MAGVELVHLRAVSLVVSVGGHRLGGGFLQLGLRDLDPVEVLVEDRRRIGGADPAAPPF
jgi:hypothetical protein